MPKISIKLGVTIPGQKEYSSLRAETEFSEIDTDGDIKAQVEECLAAIEQATQSAEEVLAQQISNLSGLNIEGVGIATKFENTMSRLRKSWDELVSRIEFLEKEEKPKKTRKKKEWVKKQKKGLF